MKTRVLAVTFGIALFAFPGRTPAALITFTGVIDEVQISAHPALFAVGDPFSATFSFNNRHNPGDPCSQGGIQSYTISFGDFTTRGVGSRDAGAVALCLDVSKTNLLYQVHNSYSYQVPAPYFVSITNIVIYDPAFGHVIPPFGQLRENFFDVALTSDQPFDDFASGHLTSFPTIRNLAPENGSSVALLGLAIFGLAVLRRRLIAREG